jgi:hypothetical protein
MVGEGPPSTPSAGIGTYRQTCPNSPPQRVRTADRARAVGNKHSAPTGAVDAAGGLLADPGHLAGSDAMCSTIAAAYEVNAPS